MDPGRTELRINSLCVCYRCTDMPSLALCCPKTSEELLCPETGAAEKGPEGARDHWCVHQQVDRGRRKQTGFHSTGEPRRRLGYQRKVGWPMLCYGQVVSISLLLLRKLQTPIVVPAWGEGWKRKNNQRFQEAASEAVLDTLPLPVLNC